MKYPIFILILLLIPFSLAICEDTDSGKDKYEYGLVTDNEEIYKDTCTDDNIKEYFCSMDDIATYSILPCVNGCEDGACQLANEQPIQMAPEEDNYPNLELYLYIIALVVIIGLYIYFFKIKRKKHY